MVPQLSGWDPQKPAGAQTLHGALRAGLTGAVTPSPRAHLPQALTFLGLFHLPFLPPGSTSSVGYRIMGGSPLCLFSIPSVHTVSPLKADMLVYVLGVPSSFPTWQSAVPTDGWSRPVQRENQTGNQDEFRLRWRRKMHIPGNVLEKTGDEGLRFRHRSGPGCKDGQQGEGAGEASSWS